MTTALAIARRCAVVACLFFLGGCGDGPASLPGSVSPPEAPKYPSVAIPGFGTDATLDIGTWNLLFFGNPGAGPSDEILQRIRVRDVIFGTDADLWAIQEASNSGAFQALLDSLPDYGGLLASDPSVEGGSASYHAGELKVGILYRKSTVRLLSAKIILADLDYEFAGRPPMEVEVETMVAGEERRVVLIALHAKASADTVSWARRKRAGEGLAAYLDERWPDVPVLVAGDWNDDVDESISHGRDTPYRTLVDAHPDWVFPTAALSARRETSILGYEDMIDHILASDEAMAWYEAESVSVHRVDTVISEYRRTTSDHLPVLARFR